MPCYAIGTFALIEGGIVGVTTPLLNVLLDDGKAKRNGEDIVVRSDGD